MWEAWTRFLPAIYPCFWKRNRKSMKAIILRERSRWLRVMLILFGLIFLRNAQAMCWPEIFLKFQNRDTTTPHFFLICCPKFCSFVQILNEVSCECFTWLKIWYATTSSLQNWARR
jgi:hypothetical protein